MKDIRLYILAILALFLFIMNRCKDSKVTKLENEKSVLEGVAAEAEFYKNKYGEEVAEVRAIQVTNSKYLLKIESQDSTVLRLQRTVRDYKDIIDRDGGAVVFTGGTTIRDTVYSTITSYDTIDSIAYPTYTFQIAKGKWINGTGYSGVEETSIDIEIYDEYSVVLGKKKNGLFKPKTTVAIVESANPYSKTQAVKAISVDSPKPTRLGIGISIGAGLTTDLNVRGYVGIGVNYNIINLR